MPIALMIFAVTFVSYVIRVNLSISILGMVKAQSIGNTTDNEDYEFQYPELPDHHLPDVSACVCVFLLTQVSNATNI